MYKDISKMRPIELGEYIGDVALELKEENSHLNRIELIDLAFKKIRGTQEGEEN
ncbi:hypothetical protein QJK96_04295 [Clostridioides difficile]|nr:hypothetical protein [Clostridioides difficile]